VRNLFSILIFLSLAIAIGVIGRHLPEIKSYFQKKKKTSWGKVFLIRHLIALTKRIGGLFLWLAESTIKRFKNLLHLMHFWLIKLRKRKQENEELREIEAKMELLEEEEKTLEKVINEDLGQEEVNSLAEKFKKKALKEEYFPEEVSVESQESPVFFQKEEISLNVVQEEKPVFSENDQEDRFVAERKADIDQKIDSFFTRNPEDDAEGFDQENVWREKQPPPEEDYSPEEKIPEEERQNLADKGKKLLSRFADRFKLGAFKKKPDWEKDFPPAEDSMGETFGSQEDFSDGIVKVGEITQEVAKRDFYQEENNLIKEVVKVGRKKEEYSDEDLGIDREILEKKIIAKISANPKDQENYRQLGDLYLKMENFRDAEECYQQVLKIKPRDITAKRKLERVRLLKRLRQR